MEQPDNDNHSEEARFNEDAESSVHLEKLNSFWHVLFKYWMLISFLWFIKDLIYGNGLETPDHVNSNTLFVIFAYLAGLPVFLWGMANCAVAFEGIRRKNLKIMSKVINSMELYAIFRVVLDFFVISSENGKDILKHNVRKNSPGYDDYGMEIIESPVFHVIMLLGWAIYYHFAYLFGAKKVRDALKAHQRSRHSL